MIIVTGSNGFIGGRIVSKLRDIGVDVEGVVEYSPQPYRKYMDRAVEFVIHMGAISDTTCEDDEAFKQKNMFASCEWAEFCETRDIPLIYASSAAVYGHAICNDEQSSDGLLPLNKYGTSKLCFDKSMERRPPKTKWYGLRLFNVYGPGESSKGRMASMVYQIYDQIKKTGEVEIFNTVCHRDFVHVDDVVSVIVKIMTRKPESGIYNVGTGTATEIEEIVHLVHRLIGPIDKSCAIKRKFLPSDLSIRFQFYTRACMSKLFHAGINHDFMFPNEGIQKYIQWLEEARNV